MFPFGFFAIFFVSTAIAEENSLKLLHLVWRHGERTPATTYPTDPYINETFSPYGWGSLTNGGKLHQYELGKWLRSRYNNFLGTKYSNQLLEAWTTDIDRTKMSAALLLAGLFPPVGEEIWNEDLLWQPIPTKNQPLLNDTLLLVVKCPRYWEALSEVRNSLVKEDLSQNKDFYEYLSKHTGQNVSSPSDVLDLHGTLTAEDSLGLKLPNWTIDVYPEKIENIAAYSFIIDTYNDELKRLKGGPLLKKILKDTKSKIKNEISSERKLYLYAGHDATVVNILRALNVWDQQLPRYNIMTLVELHKINDKYSIKVLLRNSTLHEPYLLKIPGCEELCPVEKIVHLTTSMVPEDLEKECNPKKDEYIPPKYNGP